jgi:hypothetical protein
MPGVGSPQPVSWALFQDEGFWPPPARNNDTLGLLRTREATGATRMSSESAARCHGRFARLDAGKAHIDGPGGYGLMTFMIRPAVGSAQ